LRETAIETGGSWRHSQRRKQTTRKNFENARFGNFHSCGWFGGVAAATPPNQPQRCILTDYFNNYKFSKLK